MIATITNNKSGNPPSISQKDNKIDIVTIKQTDFGAGDTICIIKQHLQGTDREVKIAIRSFQPSTPILSLSGKSSVKLGKRKRSGNGKG